MRSGLNRRFSPLFVIAPAALLAALALGGYSYRNAAQLAEQSENSVAESYRLIGKQTIDRIDNFIIDSDRSLFDLVDLEHLADFQRVWNPIVRVSPAIEAALILDENKAILPGGYVSKKAEVFRSVFMKRILPDPDLQLDALKPDFHKHMHKEYDGKDYLISYIKRERSGRTYYVVLKISLEYLLTGFFPDAFDPLAGKALYCIRDAHGRVVYGTPLGAPGRYLFEEAFPTTLYLWRLQLAPTRAEMLALESRARRRSEILLLLLMIAIIVAGIAFLIYANAKERRANALKSDFISNVSHELKTPLSLIRMFGELLALGKLKSPDKAKEYAEIITREAERLGRLIDNVLDFSRMERGRAAYDFQEGRLDEVVEREGFKLVTKIDPGLPATQIDENAMTLLLLNLLENAVKYGRGEVAVYLTQMPAMLRLVVGDQGPGIPHDEQRRIFERFYRTPGARGTNVRGSGIGLSLVKHIAEAHGGTVTVDSEPGHGAAFIVDLPLEKSQRAA
jgi:two-component system phosphate regulon sensor histidine kinase PhoR